MKTIIVTSIVIILILMYLFAQKPKKTGKKVMINTANNEMY